MPDSNFSTINTSTGTNTGIAVYGQASYSLNKKLSIIAGLRYDYEHKKLKVEGEYAADGGPSFVTVPDTSSTVSFSAFSPKLGLNYAASGNSNVFATYSRLQNRRINAIVVGSNTTAIVSI